MKSMLPTLATCAASVLVAAGPALAEVQPARSARAARSARSTRTARSARSAAGASNRAQATSRASAQATATTQARASARVSASVLEHLEPIVVTFRCRKADGSGCSSADMNNSSLRQILILPTGYAESERDDFWDDFDTMVDQMTGGGAGSSWTVTKSNLLRFVGYFEPSGELGTAQAAFGAKVPPHPIRDYALSLSQSAVYDYVDDLTATAVPNLNPFGAIVIFNTFQSDVTANASPPNFVSRAYGIAKCTRDDVSTPYIATHELAHAGLNLLDEYVEGGFQNLSINQIDILTPLALWDGSWGGFVNAISDLFGYRRLAAELESGAIPPGE